MMTRSQWLALLLGVFELAIAVPNLFSADRMHTKAAYSAILPSFFFDEWTGVYMFAAFLSALGAQRLSYAFIVADPKVDGDKKLFWPWTTLVFTHTAETMLWYACAREQPYFGTMRGSGNPLMPKNMFLLACTQATKGNQGLVNFVLLCGVPLITASFALWGP
jgi:hypothetical protein